MQLKDKCNAYEKLPDIKWAFVTSEVKGYIHIQAYKQSKLYKIYGTENL